MIEEVFDVSAHCNHVLPAMADRKNYVSSGKIGIMPGYCIMRLKCRIGSSNSCARSSLKLQYSIYAQNFRLNSNILT